MFEWESRTEENYDRTLIKCPQSSKTRRNPYCIPEQPQLP